MKFIIIYFSGTGNTELIASELGTRLNDRNHEVELISIEDRKKLQSFSFHNAVIGFGFPVYKFSYPDIFNSLFPLFNEMAENTSYFMFSTYACFTAYSFSDFFNKLDSDKFNLIAEEDFKSPSCGISARKPESDYEYKTVMFFEDDINNKLDRFTEKIEMSVQNKPEYLSHKSSLLSSLRSRIVSNIELTKYPKLQIDSSLCTLCGVCSEKCPEDNLEKSGDRILVKDDRGCLHCLRCMNHCPSNAINFGKLSRGENRYTLSIRNELFKKAAEGGRELYWKNFQKVIKAWRKNTIKYWLTHIRSPEI